MLLLVPMAHQRHSEQGALYTAECLRDNVQENQNRKNLKKKIDFLLTKHIEGYWYGINVALFYPILIRFNALSQKEIYFWKFSLI